MLYTCGLGREGQLGHGDRQNQIAPKPVTTIDTSTFVNIAAGATHTVALDQAGFLLMGLYLSYFNVFKHKQNHFDDFNFIGRVWCVGNDSVKWEEMKKLQGTRIISISWYFFTQML